MTGLKLFATEISIEKMAFDLNALDPKTEINEQKNKKKKRKNKRKYKK